MSDSEKKIATGARMHVKDSVEGITSMRPPSGSTVEPHSVNGAANLKPSESPKPINSDSRKDSK